MLDALGFQNVVDPLENAPELPSAELMFGGPVLKAAENDHKALVEMRKSIREWTAKKQPFAAAFFPEMGHDPWRNLTGNEHASVLEMGHALAVYQDGFLGEIVDELKRDHALDHTIIVVTADHGLRVTANDAGDEILISRGKVDDRTMRVPLMIYAPKVLTKTAVLAGPTSHIDIEPTILDLLGVEDKSGLQQGVAMWSAAVETRRLYLPMKVFGANGYHEQGHYYTANQAAVYRSPVMNFANGALPYSSAEAKEVRAAVAQHAALQNAIIEHLVGDAK
jgi:arylsulfatase A-like enzyme